jgi:hypothetical protein
MRALAVCLALLPVLWSPQSHAGSLPMDNADCAKILERWANDPKSVPKRLVDQCKDQLATAREEPRTWPAPAAGGPAVDPCVGPGAASSVSCWGPWASLAPAAQGPAVGANPPGPVEGYDPRPELAEPYQAVVELPLGSCAPGAPCGFATVVEGLIYDTENENQNAIFARMNLSPDGSQYTIDPVSGSDIDSVTGMDTGFFPRDDGYETLIASGSDGDQQSGLGARVVRTNSGDITEAADFWINANSATTGKNGHFAWGVTTSQGALNALNGQGVTVNFSGPMSVDNRTIGSMTLNFGTQANWTGNWVNPNYSFSAGGPMSGADLISNSSQFSANVQSGSLVQGAIMGEPGSQYVAHIIDVNLSGQGTIRDVGLLRQVTATPTSTAVKH